MKIKFLIVSLLIFCCVGIMLLKLLEHYCFGSFEKNQDLNIESFEKELSESLVDAKVDFSNDESFYEKEGQSFDSAQFGIAEESAEYGSQEDKKEELQNSTTQTDVTQTGSATQTDIKIQTNVATQTDANLTNNDYGLSRDSRIAEEIDAYRNMEVVTGIPVSSEAQRNNSLIPDVEPLSDDDSDIASASASNSNSSVDRSSSNNSSSTQDTLGDKKILNEEVETEPLRSPSVVESTDNDFLNQQDKKGDQKSLNKFDAEPLSNADLEGVINDSKQQVDNVQDGEKISEAWESGQLESDQLESGQNFDNSSETNENQSDLHEDSQNDLQGQIFRPIEQISQTPEASENVSHGQVFDDWSDSELNLSGSFNQDDDDTSSLKTDDSVEEGEK